MRRQGKVAGVGEFSLNLRHYPQSSINDPTFVFRSVQEDRGEKLMWFVSHLYVRPCCRSIPMWSLE